PSPCGLALHTTRPSRRQPSLLRFLTRRCSRRWHARTPELWLRSSSTIYYSRGPECRHTWLVRCAHRCRAAARCPRVIRLCWRQCGLERRAQNELHHPPPRAVVVRIFRLACLVFVNQQFIFLLTHKIYS